MAVRIAHSTRKQLHDGATTGMIAHAIWMAYAPEFEHTRSWSGSSYCSSDSGGTFGAVAFGADCLVGLFFDAHSSNNPHQAGGTYQLAPILGDMPDAARALAESDAMPFMLQDFEGTPVPIITAALWSEGDDLWAPLHWMTLRDHGALLVRMELLGAEEGIAEWQSNYELTEPETALLASLAARKLARPDERLILTAEEKRTVLARAVEGGEDASRRLFAQVGLTLP